MRTIFFYVFEEKRQQNGCGSFPMIGKCRNQNLWSSSLSFLIAVSPFFLAQSRIVMKLIAHLRNFVTLALHQNSVVTHKTKESFHRLMAATVVFCAT